MMFLDVYRQNLQSPILISAMNLTEALVLLQAVLPTD